MANTGNSIKDDPIREIAGSAITATYQNLETPLLRDGFRLWITNNTNGDVYVSTDGVTDMMKLPATSGRALDDKTNDMYRLHGTQFYVRYPQGALGTLGWFAIEVEYA
jgi:hypothetical protein